MARSICSGCGGIRFGRIRRLGRLMRSGVPGVEHPLDLRRQPERVLSSRRPVSVTGIRTSPARSPHRPATLRPLGDEHQSRDKKQEFPAGTPCLGFRVHCWPPTVGSVVDRGQSACADDHSHSELCSEHGCAAEKCGTRRSDPRRSLGRSARQRGSLARPEGFGRALPTLRVERADAQIRPLDGLGYASCPV